jgi:dynein heavy chain
VPLNIFLFQEIERLQDVLARCGSMLAAMKLAIKGEVVMTDDLAEAVDAFAEARPPKTWVYTVTGDEFSWIVPVLGLWFSQLLQRDQQNRTWLNNGRPFAYWLTGFSNPQGYMTAVKQEVTRRYKSNGWGLDDMVYHTEAQPMANFEAVRGPAPEGCYVYGLSMDGATYNLKNLILEESAPKVMFTLMPVVLISAAHYKEAVKINKNIFGAHGPYEAAVYKYFGRTFSPPFENAWRVGTFNLRCPPEKPAVWWGLRGLALLMNTT